MRRLLLTVAALVVLAPAAPHAASAAVPAVPAMDGRAFADTIGANTHLYYDGAYADFAMVKQRLQELGIRHIRDGFDPARRQWFYDRVNSLGAAGIKSTLINCRFTSSTDWEQFTDAAKQKVRESVEALEGINEPDLQEGGQHDGGVWWNDTRGCNYWTYRLAKGEQGTEYGPPLNVPIYGPSATGDKYKLVGDLRPGPHADGGNIHPYPGNQSPSGPDYFPFSTQMAGVRQYNFGGDAVPVIATETGYHNAVNTSSGHRPVSEKAAGIYMPRLFLEYARAGVERTFVYELVDHKPDATKTQDWNHFGLFRNDWSYKPAATAVKNLIGFLDGPQGDGAPFGYSLTNTADPDGSGSKGAVKDMLFRKADGSWWLALWQDSRVWNNLSSGDIDNTPTSVGVTLERTMKVTGYRPTLGTGTYGSGTARSFTANVDDDVLLIKLEG